MQISVIGGGPGGLYFSILTKKAMPDCQIDVYERNKADHSFGFGVVFSDETLGEFLSRDFKSIFLPGFITTFKNPRAHSGLVLIGMSNDSSVWCCSKKIRKSI